MVGPPSSLCISSQSNKASFFSGSQGSPKKYGKIDVIVSNAAAIPSVEAILHTSAGYNPRASFTKPDSMQ
ncbi:hypothetical protein Fmac_016798 [Flemingia macrophylla]|uniref:Uncharacterized protein n=1 Tax=Flemingia macrophylla TaxID=520843 RepID=A0ABD1MKM9_9FABA